MIDIKNNVSLKPFTTLKVGGAAKHFVEVTNEQELRDAVAVANQNNWKVFILAGGSNLIVSDQGFDGLVIKIGINSYKIDGDILTSGASTTMSELVDASIEAGLAGLEWAGGLPGTFGGAIRGNAGCFKGETKDNIIKVTSVDLKTLQRIERNNQECQFVYRGSIFKQVKEVIISASISLKKGDRQVLKRIAEDHINYRHERHPINHPNSGSIFKNVPVERVPADILPLFQDVVKEDPFPVVPVAKIINDAGLKGLRVGDAQISTLHTNFIINLGEATCEDVLKLIEKVRIEVKNKFRIETEVEPELVGF